MGRNQAMRELCLRREGGGRGIKLFERHLQREKLRVTYYMASSENKSISAVWRRENTKEENSIVEEAMKTMEDVGVEIQFEEETFR